MKTDDPLVVRFHIQDRERFKAIADGLFHSMMHESDYHGALVTAISVEDEFERIEEYENGER